MRIELTDNIQIAEEFRQEIYSDLDSNRLSAGFDNRYLKSIVLGYDRKDSPAALMALYCNPELKYRDFQTIAFGNYESKFDKTDSLTFLKICEKEAIFLGAKSIIGPMNGSTWGPYRFRNESASDVPLFAGEKLVQKEYSETWREYFPIEHHYFSALDVSLDASAIVSVERKKSLSDSLTFRKPKMEYWKEELSSLHELIHESFMENFLFSPLTFSEFERLYSGFDQIVGQGFTWLAEMEGKLVGFLFAYRDPTHRNRFVLKTLARLPKPEYLGVGALLTNHFYSSLPENTSVLHAFIHSESKSVEHAEKMGVETYSTYSLFAKIIHKK